MHAACYLNRDVGSFRKAWIVGTSPLAVAFLENEQPQPPNGLPPGPTRPTTTPGVVEILTRSGEAVTLDRRQRYAQLVTDADLDAQAEVVLLFPQETSLASGNVLAADGTTQPSPGAKVFHLRKPQPLRTIMRALTDRGGLGREAQHIVEIPVR